MRHLLQILLLFVWMQGAAFAHQPSVIDITYNGFRVTGTAPAVMVIDENEASDIYRIIRDNMGSAIQYESAAYGCYRNSYSPWGVRTHQAGGSTCFYRPGEEPAFGPFYRTYTGHEDLWMFGLLNANARLYSPYLGRFVSPDPLLCEDGGLLDFNPYVYARNNPYRYIDRNGEFWWFAPILIGAAVSAATYSISAAITGNWNVGDFFKSMGIGAVTAGFGVGTSLLGTQLGSFGNTFAYGLLSNMANYTITNTLFGEKMSFADIPGIVVGASVSAVLPSFSPSGTNLFKNVVSEFGINTLRGVLTGAATGSVNAMVYDDASQIWKSAVGGAVSGFTRTAIHTTSMGIPYYENSYGENAIYRKGGIAGMLGIGRGLTLGRNIYTYEKGLEPIYIENLRFHENYHLWEINQMGITKFYGTLLMEYYKYGFHGSYETEGTLEYNANKHAFDNTGIWW